MGVLDTLAAKSKARREVELILDTALESEWFALKEELSEAASKDFKGGSLAMPATTEIVNRMEAIRDRVEASQVTFTFEQLGWAERINLQAEHAPRDGNRIDALRGCNLETFTPAVIRATCVGVRGVGETESVVIPDEAWDALLPGLSYAQVDQLYSAATLVNDGLAKVPTSARFLLETKDSGASLAQPGPGMSAPSASKAGSRRTPRKSSATKRAASSA